MNKYTYISIYILISILVLIILQKIGISLDSYSDIYFYFSVSLFLTVCLDMFNRD